MPNTTFETLNISPETQKALTALGYTQPTQVQEAVITQFVTGQDLLVKSQTGSGKTASFAIPLVENIIWEERAPQAIVLAPTRELALQISEEIFNIGRFKRIKVETLIGHTPFQAQARNLKTRTHVVVATPGRLLDHIEQGTIDLTKIKFVVLDEVDEMLSMGFMSQVDDIFEHLSQARQVALFSATLPQAVLDVKDFYVTDPITIEVAAQNAVSTRIDQVFYLVEKTAKLKNLYQLLVLENPDSAIIFANTRAAVDAIADYLDARDVTVETLHGGMEQRDRTRVINDFKHNYFRYLIATDVAARGIDVADIAAVFNYDLPDNPESYTHRIGRTARFEKTGRAISLVSSAQRSDFAAIEKAQQKNDVTITEHVLPSDSLLDKRLPSFTAKQKRELEKKQAKSAVFKSDIMKLHINAGKKTKLRAGDVVGAITSIPGVTGDDIGIISIIDVSTFVEILNGKGKQVLKALQTEKIKGRLRKVSRANQGKYD
ncbi:DEAD/DEAH box helicase [Pseudolactococcus insecticola]|uniref:ATP-dependent RNA helicase DbpA n=1 Tax=Pseudolactococcus insecticola TaxID=2709158 RepID=A0A6A0B6U9_9LACT|nr:DEAD/DEAH box helicase [Lactococcus insecticola]GFH40676.1 ATP-dependent RNA helicase DbpA [Lactococcus insecticola]